MGILLFFHLSIINNFDYTLLGNHIDINLLIVAGRE